MHDVLLVGSRAAGHACRLPAPAPALVSSWPRVLPSTSRAPERRRPSHAQPKLPRIEEGDTHADADADKRTRTAYRVGTRQSAGDQRSQVPTACRGPWYTDRSIDTIPIVGDGTPYAAVDAGRTTRSRACLLTLFTTADRRGESPRKTDDAHGRPPGPGPARFPHQTPRVLPPTAARGDGDGRVRTGPHAARTSSCLDAGSWQALRAAAAPC